MSSLCIQLTVESGRFKVLQHSMTGITQESPPALLLIASVSARSLRAPPIRNAVAVTAALLIGLGF